MSYEILENSKPTDKVSISMLTKDWIKLSGQEVMFCDFCNSKKKLIMISIGNENCFCSILCEDCFKKWISKRVRKHEKSLK